MYIVTVYAAQLAKYSDRDTSVYVCVSRPGRISPARPLPAYYAHGRARAPYFIYKFIIRYRNMSASRSRAGR